MVSFWALGENAPGAYLLSDENETADIRTDSRLMACCLTFFGVRGLHRPLLSVDLPVAELRHRAI